MSTDDEDFDAEIIQEQQQEARWELSRSRPMPRILEKRVGTYIEPQTMHDGTDHEAAMDAIKVAWPVIMDHLKRYPHVLDSWDVIDGSDDISTSRED